MHPIYLYTILLFFVSCDSKKDEFKNPAGYDLTKPEKFLMPEVLNEISGINLHNHSIYAIQDEEGKLFYLRAGDKSAGSSKFGKRGDYEDLAIVRGQVIILRSDGTLFGFPLTDARRKKVCTIPAFADV